LLHLVGAAVFAALGVGLLQRARENGLPVAVIAIYVAGVLFVLTVSGIFHALPRETDVRYLFKILDHAGIFFLIAATFTPVHLLQLQGFMRWGMLALVWLAAVTAIVVKSIWFDAMPEWLGLTLYLGLGWAGLISAVALYRIFGLAPLAPLLGGAVAYTLGAALEFAEVPTIASGIFASHEIFHVLVLVGVALHWEYIRRVVVASHWRVDPSYAGSRTNLGRPKGSGALSE
jgi:channel protein (hemolysin III family)